LTPILKMFYPAPEHFECDGLGDILRAYPKVRHLMLSIRSVRRNRHDRGQSKAHNASFLERAGVMAKAIQESGELDAILVARHADGYRVCLDGHHRLAACRILGMRTIPVVAVVR